MYTKVGLELEDRARVVAQKVGGVAQTIEH